MKSMTIAVFLLSLMLHFASCDIYYITPSLHSPCTVDGVKKEPCLLLSHFATSGATTQTNTTLVLLEGDHTLTNKLLLKNISNLTVLSRTSPHSTTVTCTNPGAKLTIERSEHIHIGGIKLRGCGRHTIKSVKEFMIEDCIIEGDKNINNETGLDLEHVTKAKISGSFFIFNNGGWVKDQDSTQTTNRGGCLIVLDSNTTITNSTFESNTAGTCGGVVYADNNSNVTISLSSFSHNNAAWGGVLYASGQSRVIAMLSTFYHNSANVSGGVVYAGWNSKIAIDSSEFVNNTAYQGGAMYVWESEVEITNSSFDRNRVEQDGYGGVLYMWNCDVLIAEGSSFRDNEGDKGGVMHLEGSKVTVSDSLFSSNRAWYGGAVSVTEYSIVTFISVAFTSNIAKACGGVLYMEHCTVSLVGDVSLEHNVAKEQGGVAYAQTGKLELFGSGRSVVLNNSANFGGVIAAVNGSVVRMLNFVHVRGNVAHKRGAVIYIEQGNASLVTNRYSSNTAHHDGGVMYASESDILINNCEFIANSARHNGGVIRANANSVILEDCVFIKNRALNSGGIVYMDSKSSLGATGVLDFHNNSGNIGIVYIEHSIVHFSEVTVTSTYNIGSFVFFSSNVILVGNFNFSHSRPSNSTACEKFQEGGAITAFQSLFEIVGMWIFTDNYASNGAAILASESKVVMIGYIVLSGNTASDSGGGIHVYQSEVKFFGKNAIANNTAVKKGGGIHAVSSTLKLMNGSLFIVGNSASKGGGMCLELNSKLYIIKDQPEIVSDDLADMKSWIKLGFYSNSAEYGGALYVTDETNSGTCSITSAASQSMDGECFFQVLLLHAQGNDLLAKLNVNNTHFIDNTATKAGPILDGGLLDRCTVSPFAEIFITSQNCASMDAVSFLTQVTNIKQTDVKSSISSKPVRVCFCNNGEPDCDYQPPTIYTMKGKPFKVSLVAVDHVNNTVSPAKILSVPSSQEAGLGEGQHSQNTNDTCTDLEFSIVSPQDTETLLLSAKGPCKNTGKSQRRLEVEFLPCSCLTGLEPSLSNTTCECVCDHRLNAYVSHCSNATGQLTKDGDFWIAYSKKAHDYIIYPHCPFDYCCDSSEKPVYVNFNSESGADGQCAFNRTGLLCGSCSNDLSVSFGSSCCQVCSNFWLLLVIPFAIAGIALVALLLFCNMTVAVGTINGLILYANIVLANKTTFLTFQKPNFLTVFIAWLNLDLGIETCFYDGMDAYAKTWLQLAFPLYIFSLVILIIVVCEHSQRASRFFAGRNPVATLATLILLSYTKLLRIIIAALSFANIHHPDGSHKTLWLVDANVPYLKGKHIPLFIVALVVLLFGSTYTFVLFFWQWLLRCPNRRMFLWMRNTRLYCFIDAYHNPYNPRHRYWVGLLLLVRTLLYLVSTFNMGGDPHVNLLVIVCTSAGLIVLKQHSAIYKKWTLDALESSFLLNILIFAAATWYNSDSNGNQYVLAVTSISIAFVSFLFILMYHMYISYASKNKTWKKFVKSIKRQTSHNSEEMVGLLESYEREIQQESEPFIELLPGSINVDEYDSETTP